MSFSWSSGLPATFLLSLELLAGDAALGNSRFGYSTDHNTEEIWLVVLWLKWFKAIESWHHTNGAVGGETMLSHIQTFAMEPNNSLTVRKGGDGGGRDAIPSSTRRRSDQNPVSVETTRAGKTHGHMHVARWGGDAEALRGTRPVYALTFWSTL
ncbi:unnamed protein product [Arctogadus glacialis]